MSYLSKKAHIKTSNLKILKKNIHFFDSIPSTMEKAKELAQNGASHFSIIVAKEQTKGRGRLNRVWLSDQGGLWFTVILRPILAPSAVFILNFAASLSIAKILRQKYLLNVNIKWPNDILFNGKKIVGLLSEMETKDDVISFINIGIGINVNNNPETYQTNAISMKTALLQLQQEVQTRQEDISIIDLLDSFLIEFEKEIIKVQFKPDYVVNLMEQWKLMSSTIGKKVRIETLNAVYNGVAIDIDQEGALIIKDDLGNIRRIIFGDCFY